MNQDLFAPPGTLTTREALSRAIKSHRNERFEKMFAHQCRSFKLPQWHEQYFFAEEIRRRFRADFAWPQFRLLVEIQGGIWRRGGGAHSHPTKIEGDIERQQIAALLGWFMCPVTTDQVKNGQAIAIVQRVLAARGWEP